MCLPCLGGTVVPCPPLCVSSGTCLVSFSFTLALGRAHVLLWEEGWRGGVGGWFVGVRVAPCYLPEQG